MKAAMQELVDHVGGNKDDTLHHALTELKSGVGGDFSKKLEDVLQSFMTEIKKTTVGDAQNLKKQIESISELVTILTAQIGMQTGKLDDFIKLLDGKIDTIAGVAEASQGAITKAAEDAGLKVADAAKPIVDVVGDFTVFADKLSNIKEQIESFERSTKSLQTVSEGTLQSTNVLTTSVDALKGASSTMGNAAESFGTNLDKLQDLPTKLGEITVKASEISSKSEQAYKYLAQAYSDLLETNKQSVKSLEDSLKVYQNTTEGSVKKILGETQGRTEVVLGAMSAGVTAYKKSSDEHIESNLKIQRKEVEEYITKANDLLKTTISNYDKQLEEFASGLSSAIGELNDALSDLSIKLSKGK